MNGILIYVGLFMIGGIIGLFLSPLFVRPEVEETKKLFTILRIIVIIVLSMIVFAIFYVHAMPIILAKF